MVITWCLIAPALEITVFVDTFHHLVVVLHNQVFGQFVPTLHHFVGVGDAFVVEIAAAVGGHHLLDGVEHAVLVSEIIVFQFVLCLAEVANHHGIAGVDHVGHPVVHPESRLITELVTRVVLGTEAVGHLGDAAIERHVCYHVGIVAVEPCDATHVVG